MEDEEFEKWWKENQQSLRQIGVRAIAKLAWNAHASLDVYRTEDCEGCGMYAKLAPCRPPHMCRRFEKKVCKKCNDMGKILEVQNNFSESVSVAVKQCDCTKVTL